MDRGINISVFTLKILILGNIICLACAWIPETHQDCITIHKEVARSETNTNGSYPGWQAHKNILPESNLRHHEDHSRTVTDLTCAKWNHVSSECERLAGIPQCFTCRDKNDDGSKFFGSNYTMCYAITPECLNETFEKIDNNTENLVIVIVNNWIGYLPLSPGAIDLTPMARLTSLTTFRLTPCYQDLLQPFPVRYTDDTFVQLKNLTELYINVPTWDRAFKGMVKQLPWLRKLDLSFTRQLSMKSMTETLAATYSNTLESLYLITFQCVGCEGYRSSLHLPTFFSNKTFPRLKDLVLSENAIARLSPGIFEHTPNLKYFAISGNLLLDSHNIALIIESILHPKLEVFDMAYQGYVGGGKTSYRHTPRDNHQNKTDNRISDVADLPVKYRSTIYLFNCVNLVTNATYKRSNFSYFFTNVSISNKRLLGELLKCILPLQFDKGPPIEALPDPIHILDTNCSMYSRIPLGQNLSMIFMSQLHWEATQTLGVTMRGNWCFAPNNLTYFAFTENSYWIKAAKLKNTIENIRSVTGLQNLKQLNLSSNKMNISLNFVTNQVFFPKLEQLNVADNDFEISPKFQFCSKNTTLRNLDFSGNSLGTKHLTTEFLNDCSKLRELSLASNKLNNTPEFYIDFTNLLELEYLDLSHNLFTNLSSKMMKAIDEHSQNHRKININLINNALICNCETLEFTKWLVHHVLEGSHSNVTFSHFNTYLCVDIHSSLKKMKGITKAMISDFERYCAPENSMAKTLETIGGTLASVVFLSFLVMVYKKRWRIRYKVFLAWQNVKFTVTPKDDSESTTQKWKYDAFVSYCTDDRFWVHGIFRKMLEETYGFHLCLRYRDFAVGPPIANEILENMKASREIVVIVSDTALANGWNNFELEHGNLQNSQRRKRLIIIKLGDLQNLENSALMANLLDIHGYLEWAEDENQENLFWAKLVQKLYGQRTKCCCTLFSCCKEREYQELQDTAYL